VGQGFPTVDQFEAHQIARFGPERYPLIAKQALGSSSIGLTRLDDDSEKMRWSQRAEYVFQTIARGVEYTVDVWMDREHRARCAVPRQRIEVRAGEVSKGVTRRHAVLQTLASDICERLPRAYGVLNVQIFWDETNGTAKVIEVNARYGGGFPLAWKAGADYPTWMIEDLTGLRSTCDAEVWANNLAMLRYDDAIFVDASKIGL
jgi:carbamoyl-phosphate synthase large subunit